MFLFTNTQPSSVHSQTPQHLLRPNYSALPALPAELHDHIYTHTLASYGILVDNCFFRDYHGPRFSVVLRTSSIPRHWMWTSPKIHADTALHYTCRQIRHETSYLTFALSTFRVFLN